MPQKFYHPTKVCEAKPRVSRHTRCFWLANVFTRWRGDGVSYHSYPFWCWALQETDMVPPFIHVVKQFPSGDGSFLSAFSYYSTVSIFHTAPSTWRVYLFVHQPLSLESSMSPVSPNSSFTNMLPTPSLSLTSHYPPPVVTYISHLTSRHFRHFQCLHIIFCWHSIRALLSLYLSTHSPLHFQHRIAPHIFRTLHSLCYLDMQRSQPIPTYSLKPRLYPC